MRIHLAIAIPLVLAVENHPVVSSTSGDIIGHRAPGQSGTVEFLGIKYGEAPIGDLRFAAPVRYQAPAGTVYNASRFNADCPANIPPRTTFPNFTRNGLAIYSKFTAQNNNTQSEDCLALNIWTKSPRDCGKSNKPVFIFFHGGRFTIPGPNSQFYNGKYLADAEDVVVVTISYRLGIFGFPGAPGVEQNAALLDQRSAVEWVRDNIANFGGDPLRIIIFGQSAGGSSVDYWSYAYRSDPIIAGHISHSGTAFSFVPNEPSYSQSLFYNVSGTLGCGNTSIPPEEVIACVRSAPVSALLAAARIVPPLPSPALSQAAFHPTIDNITVFPLSTYTSLSQNGSFAPIPYLAGNADYEAGFYRISAFNANRSLTNEQWDLFNQRAFTCPTKYATDARVRAGVPTWRYRYVADFENLRLYDASNGFPDSGAYHGVELSLLFGTTGDVTGQADSEAQERTRRYLQGAWAAFARDPMRGLDGYGWPGYGLQTEGLVLLGDGEQEVPRFVAPEEFDGPCPAVEENDPVPGRGAF
ncbi:hypothetical protein CAC42_8033 [Sphaceloma murrayae]|uniref:Carboxylic ester hydrolase n=1 Tax=Sphaceloma murrayae TaxID=2082308 RepID=A0A2K1QRD6_9PEZI|nr:hypothetical protein CAC42_8033 [Sphaceloma murrayae]